MKTGTFEKPLSDLKEREEYGEKTMINCYERVTSTCGWHHSECYKRVTNKTEKEGVKGRYEKESTSSVSNDHSSEQTDTKCELSGQNLTSSWKFFRSSYDP